MKEPTKTSTSKDHTKLPCKIMACSCKHEAQDKLHGRNMRVWNPMKNELYTCTSCGTEKR